MNGRPVAVAASMIVVGAAGLVVGTVTLASGYWPSVGLVAFGVLLVVLGAALLRETKRAARRRPSETDSAGYGFYPGPAGDAGSGWHVDRQRDHDNFGRDHDSSGGTEPVGGTDSRGGWSGSGWSGGDSGGGWSGGGGDSGGGGGGGGS
ncbi:hypothetical protein [Micromonospora trifolii]|uniref:hypothetical protein n=1 Tax=Micromonospora trifolii TaxID=2911208 RepID=UPI003CF0BBAB